MIFTDECNIFSYTVPLQSMFLEASGDVYYHNFPTINCGLYIDFAFNTQVFTFLPGS